MSKIHFETKRQHLRDLLGFRDVVLENGIPLRLFFANDFTKTHAGEVHLYVSALSPLVWDFGWQPRNTDPGFPVEVRQVGLAEHRLTNQTYSFHRPDPVWGGFKSVIKSVLQNDCYLPHHYDHNRGYNFDPADPAREPHLFMKVEVTFEGETVSGDVISRTPTTGHIVPGEKGAYTVTTTVDATSHVRNCVFGENDRWPGSLSTLRTHFQGSTIEGGKDALWLCFLQAQEPAPMDGLTKVYKKYAANLAQLESHPTDFAFFKWLHGNKTQKGVKNNQLLITVLETVGGDFATLIQALQKARLKIDSMDITSSTCSRDFLETMPGAKERLGAADAAKDFRKAETLREQVEGLGLDKSLYPKFLKALHEGKIPIAVLSQPNNDPVNREFALWEKALGQKGWAETIYEIAASAAKRNTYERDITPYLSFLFKLPKYLDKYAGRGWRSVPKFVSSSSELEMDEADENGTVKRRSALTPVADNETRTVTIPYVALSVGGARTQWCYSQHYYVFEEGLTDPESGGIVVRDFEPKLNGKDDYGLCYYTLTGTQTARGYPTFLIIFEKREAKVKSHPNCEVCQGNPQGHSYIGCAKCRQHPKAPNTVFVHFHRVRPCRSKDGVKTPACELVEACYQYMAGNIAAADITAQQGDMILIRQEHDPVAAGAKVEPDPTSGVSLVFESHAFRTLNPEGVLTLHRNAAKQPANRLGFLHAPLGLKVEHPEHDHIEALPPGWYEVRRCKSWEANPQAIWSYTID